MADAAERSDGACKGESVAAEGLTAERSRAAAATRPLPGFEHGPGQAGIRSIRCQPRWACCARPFRGRRSAPGGLGTTCVVLWRGAVRFSFTCTVGSGTFGIMHHSRVGHLGSGTFSILHRSRVGHLGSGTFGILHRSRVGHLGSGTFGSLHRSLIAFRSECTGESLRANMQRPVGTSPVKLNSLWFGLRAATQAFERDLVDLSPQRPRQSVLPLLPRC